MRVRGRDKRVGEREREGGRGRREIIFNVPLGVISVLQVSKDWEDSRQDEKFEFVCLREDDGRRRRKKNMGKRYTKCVKNEKLQRGKTIWHTKKKTHKESQNVWKEKWRQSLWANSHHICRPSSASADHTSLSTGAVIKPSLQVCGWVILTRVNRTRLMVRNSTQGPQSWWHNGDRVNEKVVNVWVGADNVYVAVSLRVLFYFLLSCVMLWTKYMYVFISLWSIRNKAKKLEEHCKCR